MWFTKVLPIRIKVSISGLLILDLCQYGFPHRLIAEIQIWLLWCILFTRFPDPFRLPGVF
jgi:hypothetical protein